MSTDFTVEISQNEYLAEGGDDVNAIVTVTSPDTGLAAPVDDHGSAEIIIIDCSGSMDYPPTKMSQAKAATAAAIDVVRDGVGFAVVAGTSPGRRSAEELTLFKSVGVAVEDVTAASLVLRA